MQEQNSIRISNLVFVLILCLLFLCNFLLSFIPFEAKNEGQKLLIQWPFVLFVAVWGTAGFLLSRKINFPELWDPRTPTPQKWILPALLGTLTGVGSILFDIIRPVSDVFGLASIHHPLPEGLVVYLLGGLVSEIFYHLLPVPLLMYGISILLLKRKRQDAVFWGIAIVLSFWESRHYLADTSKWDWVESGRHAVTYSANLAEIWLFRSFGFLAALEQRFSSYLFWHILWPWFSGR